MKRFLLAALWTVTTGLAGADEFYHDFRKGPLPEGLRPFQAQKQDLVKFEPEGLRITIPNDWKHPFGGVGVASTFGMQGDFEVTTTYEILQAETPPTGYGVGASLRLDRGEGRLVNLSRLVRPGGKQIVLWNWSVEADGKTKYPEGPAPCVDTIGRLRLKRTGTTLSWQWAAGTVGEDFKMLHAVELGAEDIKRVLLVGVTGGQLLNVDVRFLDLRVQSGGAPVVQAGAESAPLAGQTPSQVRRLWWLVPVGILAGLLVIVLAVRRLRNRPVGTVAGPDKGDGAIEVQCPGCQKRLKVAASAAGKKIKCPACAATFVGSSSS